TSSHRELSSFQALFQDRRIHSILPLPLSSHRTPVPRYSCKGCPLRFHELLRLIGSAALDSAGRQAFRPSIKGSEALRQGAWYEFSSNYSAISRWSNHCHARSARAIRTGEQIAIGVPFAPSSRRLGRSLSVRQDRKRIKSQTRIPIDEQLSRQRNRNHLGDH